MRRWNIQQKQLIAEGLSNLAIGSFLIGVITPLFAEIKDVKLYFVKGITMITFSIAVYIISLRILER